MTNVGKIFTVVVFMMSIVYMGLGVLVLATHKNWRDAVNGDPADPANPGFRKLLADAEAVNKQLRAEIEDLNKRIAQEQVSRRLVIGALRMKLDVAEKAVGVANEQLAKLTSDQGLLVKQMETQQQNLDKFTNETMALREAIKKAQTDRDVAFKDYVATLEQFNQASTQLSTLEERNKIMADELALRTEIMNKKQISLNERVEQLAQDVKGEIREISDNKVVISVGFDDGIRMGQELDVFTKTAYRGKVRIIKVEPDKAVGEIIPEYTKGRMQRGDNVANKIS